MSGMDVVKKMEQLGTADGKPDGHVKIVDCGETSKTKMSDSVPAERGTEECCFLHFSYFIFTFILIM